MTVTLTPQMESMVEERIASGQYEDAGAVLLEALRLLEERDQKLAWLRAEIQKGLDDIERGNVVEYGPGFLGRGRAQGCRASTARGSHRRCHHPLGSYFWDQAVDYLADSRRFGTERWGPDQADAYQASIKRTLDSLAIYPNMGVERGDYRPRMRGLQVGRHKILNVVDQDTITIVALINVRKNLGHGAE